MLNSSQRRELFLIRRPTPKWSVRTRVKIMWNTSGGYRVQHVVCPVVQRDCSAVRPDRVGIASVLALFHWLKPLTDEGGEET